MPPIATGGVRAVPSAPEPAASEAEAEDEAGAEPEKPLVF